MSRGSGAPESDAGQPMERDKFMRLPAASDTGANRANRRFRAGYVSADWGSKRLSASRRQFAQPLDELPPGPPDDATEV